MPFRYHAAEGRERASVHMPYGAHASLRIAAGAQRATPRAHTMTRAVMRRCLLEARCAPRACSRNHAPITTTPMRLQRTSEILNSHGTCPFRQPARAQRPMSDKRAKRLRCPPDRQRSANITSSRARRRAAAAVLPLREARIVLRGVDARRHRREEVSAPPSTPAMPAMLRPSVCVRAAT